MSSTFPCVIPPRTNLYPISKPKPGMGQIESAIQQPGDGTSGASAVSNSGHDMVKLEQAFSIKSLGSPIVTLRVGPTGVVLTAHKAVLTTTAYFAKCLEKDHFKEGETNNIDLPEDHPSDVARIIRFLYTGSFRDKEYGDQEGFGRGHTNPFILTELIDVYAIADKYCVQAMCKQVLDIAARDPGPRLVWGHVQQLKEVGLQDSALWKSIMLRVQRSLLTESNDNMDLEQLWKQGLSFDQETTGELMGQLIGRFALDRKKPEKQQSHPIGNSSFAGVYNGGLFAGCSSRP